MWRRKVGRGTEEMSPGEAACATGVQLKGWGRVLGRGKKEGVEGILPGSGIWVKNNGDDGSGGWPEEVQNQDYCGQQEAIGGEGVKSVAPQEAEEEADGQVAGYQGGQEAQEGREE